MFFRAIILAALSLLDASAREVSAAQATPAVTPRADGFRGIWFDLRQESEFGSKYSGGLGTYTANHVPMAHYVKEVNRTYFTWGGTPAANQRRLQPPPGARGRSAHRCFLHGNPRTWVKPGPPPMAQF